MSNSASNGSFLGSELVPTVSELMRLRAVAAGSNPFDLDEWSARKQVAALASGKRLTGHTARLMREPLWSYLAGGVSDDHNAVTTEEVLERLRLGAMLTVMAGSMNDNCQTVFADWESLRDGLYHIAFCADDKHVEDLYQEGHIDHHVRQTIKCGVEPLLAWGMATLSPALYYRLDQLLGSITPSRLADIQLVPDLREARSELVIVGGNIVAEGGKPCFENDDPIPDWTRSTVHLSPRISAQSFAVDANTGSALGPSDGNVRWIF